MKEPIIYRSSKSRITQRQKKMAEERTLILAYVAQIEQELTAEEIWLGLKGNKLAISVSSFYTRLKELVKEDLIQRKSVGYNKFLYWINKSQKQNE